MLGALRAGIMAALSVKKLLPRAAGVGARFGTLT